MLGYDRPYDVVEEENRQLKVGPSMSIASSLLLRTQDSNTMAHLEYSNIRFKRREIISVFAAHCMIPSVLCHHPPPVFPLLYRWASSIEPRLH